MKKLEDIPKKQVFDVPEGYFEKLPGIIQARVASGAREKYTRPVFSYALRYALPLVAVFALVIFWFNREVKVTSAESILASIETADLVAYLDDADLSTDELLEDVILDSNDVDEIEGAVYGFEQTDKDIEDLLDEI
ncbi:MAG: hypothetical protein C0490_12035 [Marivirga sp.]|nr:hypothetical protein [Marivirga sp.]